MFQGAYFFSLISSFLIISSFMLSQESFIFLRQCNFCASLTVISFACKVTINSWSIASSVQPVSAALWNTHSLILKSAGKHTKTCIRFRGGLFGLGFFYRNEIHVDTYVHILSAPRQFLLIAFKTILLYYGSSCNFIFFWNFPGDWHFRHEVPLCTSFRCLL